MPDNPVLFRHNFLPIVVRITSIPREEDPFKGIPLSVCKELIGLELKATFWSGPINDFFRKTDHRIVKWFVMCDEIKKKLVEKFTRTKVVEREDSFYDPSFIRRIL